MQTRTLLATATLTALLLSVGTLQPAPIEGAAQLALQTQLAAPDSPQSAEGPAAARWGAAFGFESEGTFLWGVLSAIVCGVFTGPGGIACGITGAA